MGLFNSLKKLLNHEKQEQAPKIAKDIENKFDENYYIQEYKEPEKKTSSEIEMANLGRRIALQNFQNGGMNQNQQTPVYKKHQFKQSNNNFNFPKANSKEFVNELKPRSSADVNKNQDRCYGLFAKDGDTFVGMYQNEQTTFRLAGINTPEKGQFNYDKAKFFLKDLIYKKNLYITLKGKDPYNRSIAEVFLDPEKTQSINKMLLEAGLAKSERYSNASGALTHSENEFIDNEMIEKAAQARNFKT